MKNAVWVLLSCYMLFLVFASAPYLLPVKANSAPSPSVSLQANTAAAAPVQPIPFSHKKHAAINVPCDYCHAKLADGVRISYPETSKCMVCHSAIAKERPAIQKLAEFNASGKPVPWEQVYSVPGFVFWSHGTHLDAGVVCASCHGDVAEMETMRKVTDVTTMAGCVNCHKQKNAPTGCLVCHETQSSRWTYPRLRPRAPELQALLR